VALVAAALEPDSFTDLVIRKGLRSWKNILAKHVRYQETPELF
jgi:hypothetical protein